MEDFTHSVHHDLRTPLTIVLGQAQLAERALKIGNEEMVQRSLEAVKKSARRMNQMIEDMVDVARVGTGTIVLHRESVSLPRFVAGLLERIAGVLDVTRIKIDAPADQLPDVSADLDRLERILTNLLSNALKFSEREVIVKFELCDGVVSTSVIDRGIGISAEDTSHMFEPYYRAPEVRKTEGLGLGLHTTKMLVEAQGGKIWLDSAPGQGTTASFSLPTA
jgi:signal transduction histidine kinase